MEAAATAEQFEKAAMYRDQLAALKIIQEQQDIVTTGAGDTDVIGFYAEGDKTAVQIYTIRGGKLMGRENFSLDNSNDESTAALTGAVLDQYYVEGVFIPREIVVPDVEDKEAYEHRLGVQKGRNVDIIIPRRGVKKRLLEMAENNAKVLWELKR